MLGISKIQRFIKSLIVAYALAEVFESVVTVKPDKISNKSPWFNIVGVDQDVRAEYDDAERAFFCPDGSEIEPFAVFVNEFDVEPEDTFYG